MTRGLPVVPHYAREAIDAALEEDLQLDRRKGVWVRVPALEWTRDGQSRGLDRVADACAEFTASHLDVKHVGLEEIRAEYGGMVLVLITLVLKERTRA